MPDDKPVPSPAPSPAAKAASVAASIVDLVAILVVGGLAYVGKVNGDFALGLIGLLAGVRVMDVFGGKGGPPAGGMPVGTVGPAAFLIATAGALVEGARRLGSPHV